MHHIQKRRSDCLPFTLVGFRPERSFGKRSENLEASNSSMSVLLVIDDDLLVHHRFRRDFENSDLTLLMASSALEGLDMLAREPVDVVLLDVMLPDLPGLETFQRIRQIDPKIPVIFITAGAESDTAIDAMKLGAYDYLLKPLDRAEVRELVTRALEIRRLMQTPVELSQTDHVDHKSRDVLIGRCPPMQEVYKAIGRVASQDVTVLILGESGTGKELVARAIYQHSLRADGPFLAINCAAIPESLLESELFGHEKGSFTGADRRRIGKFEQCSGGTLFLDEIGDMAPATQSKVLRLLQEQRFERVGGTETIQTDVRILTATNHDLKRAVEAGQFRTDLYYRLNVFSIALPPLRERQEDLPLLLDHFLALFSRDLGKDVRSFAPNATEMLKRYHWPGNIRELQSVLKQAILRATGPLLLPDFLPESVTGTSRANDAPQPHANGGIADSDWQQFIRRRLEEGSESLYAESVERLEAELLTAVLRHTDGNQLQAAKILGVTRGTLRNKIRSLGISIDRVIHAHEPSAESAS
jgi:nitrogen regulation protein NR(I)